MHLELKEKLTKEHIESDLKLARGDLEDCVDKDKKERIGFFISKFEMLLNDMNERNHDYVCVNYYQFKKLIRILKGECDIPDTDKIKKQKGESL